MKTNRIGKKCKVLLKELAFVLKCNTGPDPSTGGKLDHLSLFSSHQKRKSFLSVSIPDEIGSHPEAVYTDANFVSYDSVFQQRQNFHRDVTSS
jgi:hypothetical protein